jgi:hypothetical protein
MKLIKKLIKELDPIPEGYAVVYYNNLEQPCPEHLRECLVCYPKEIAEILLKVLRFFATGEKIKANLLFDSMVYDHAKMTMWMTAPNAHFGNKSPEEMIEMGKFDRVKQFIEEAL